MGDAAVDLYRALVPGHAAVPPTTISVFIGQASLQHSPAAFGALFTTAMVYYAAHMVEKTPGLGPSLASEVATVTGQTDGDVSRQYQTAMSTDPNRRNPWLSTTVYGQQYLSILAGLPATKPITIWPGS
jgi:hypothetical protein